MSQDAKDEPQSQYGQPEYVEEIQTSYREEEEAPIDEDAKTLEDEPQYHEEYSEQLDHRSAEEILAISSKSEVKHEEQEFQEEEEKQTTILGTPQKDLTVSPAPLDAPAKKVLPSAPKTLTDSLCPQAQEFVALLTAAFNSGNGDELADIVFDAEQEDEVAAQIDLEWYEQQAA